MCRIHRPGTAEKDRSCSGIVEADTQAVAILAHCFRDRCPETREGWDVGIPAWGMGKDR
jgi:hypothetical protein